MHDEIKYLKGLSDEVLVNKSLEPSENREGELVRIEMLVRMVGAEQAENCLTSKNNVFSLDSCDLFRLKDHDLINKFYDASVLLTGGLKILKDIKSNEVAWYMVRDEILRRMR